MSKEDKIEEVGKVIATKGRGFFMVALESGTEILCTLSGKIRKNNIMVIDGDLVKIEISPYDLTKGIIKYRKAINNSTMQK